MSCPLFTKPSYVSTSGTDAGPQIFQICGVKLRGPHTKAIAPDRLIGSGVELSEDAARITIKERYGSRWLHQREAGMHGDDSDARTFSLCGAHGSACPTIEISAAGVILRLSREEWAELVGKIMQGGLA
jgi:hypothetical protein